MTATPAASAPTQSGPFYVYACDLADALIGPFSTTAEAEAHIAFCAARGDGAEARVVSAQEADALRPGVGTELTAAEDRATVLPCPVAAPDVCMAADPGDTVCVHCGLPLPEREA